jgi:hypothetical protein
MVCYHLSVRHNKSMKNSYSLSLALFLGLVLLGCAQSPTPRFITTGQDFTVHYTPSEEAIVNPVFAGKNLAVVTYPVFPLTITSSTIQLLRIDPVREQRIHTLLPNANVHGVDMAATLVTTLHMNNFIATNPQPIAGTVTPKGNLVPDTTLQSVFPKSDFLLDLHPVRWEVTPQREMKLVYTLTLLDLKNRKQLYGALISIDTPDAFANHAQFDWEQHILNIKQAMLAEAASGLLRKLPATLSSSSNP